MGYDDKPRVNLSGLWRFHVLNCDVGCKKCFKNQDCDFFFGSITSIIIYLVFCGLFYVTLSIHQINRYSSGTIYMIVFPYQRTTHNFVSIRFIVCLSVYQVSIKGKMQFTTYSLYVFALHHVWLKTVKLPLILYLSLHTTSYSIFCLNTVKKKLINIYFALHNIVWPYLHWFSFDSLRPI